MKIGIIGAGFAREAFLPALRHVPGAEVVALAAARVSSARATAADFSVPHAYGDWREMLARHSFELVLIATPTDLHAPMTLAALAGGAHVMCEKPTALNASEAKIMLDMAEALGRVHMINHELRFNANRCRIAEIIGSGELGEIRHINISAINSAWSDPASRPRNDWWSLAERGGGRLGANGSHQVDLVRWWLGPVASVVGEAVTMVPHRRDNTTGEDWAATADDVTTFILRLQSGALAQIFISSVSASNIGNETRIFGSKGTLILDKDNDLLLHARSGSGFTDISVDDHNARLEGINGGLWNISMVAALRELIEAIGARRRLKRGATFFDGLANQRVLDAVRESTRTRAWVDLPPEPSTR